MQTHGVSSPVYNTKKKKIEKKKQAEPNRFRVECVLVSRGDALLIDD